MPVMSQLYFLGKFDTTFKLSALQTAILVGVGMQSHTMDQIATQLDLPTGQLLAMFNKTVRKVSSYLKRLEENEAREEINNMNKKSKNRTKKVSKQDDKVEKTTKTDAKVATTTVPEEFMQYAIKGNDKDWDTALQKRAESGSNGTVTVRRKRDHKEDEGELK